MQCLHISEVLLKYSGSPDVELWETNHLKNGKGRTPDLHMRLWQPPGLLSGVLWGLRSAASVTMAHCCHMFRHRFSYRPTDDSNQPPGRGVLSMHGLTYGVIRVDSEEKLSVLTVQDVGLVMPGGACGPRALTAGSSGQDSDQG